MKALDLKGRRFGRLVAVVATNDRNSHGDVMWHCECDCGGYIRAGSTPLIGGKTRSCGCLFDETRHLCGLKAVRAWKGGQP